DDNDAGGCSAATAVLETSVTARGEESGIATDLPIAAGAPTRRAATPEEAAAMTEFLRRAVTGHGDAWKDGADVRVSRILLPSGPEVLAGSVEIAGESDDDPPSAAAFVIAERAGGAYRPVATWLPSRGVEMYDQPPRSRVLLDAADLDGDGSPELVTRTGFQEWSQYTIYHRGPRGWAVAWEASGGGC
ncbi:MAG TPA: hypothetical protein VF771_04620, partial [Longimicrobiaceae bacterium]